MFSLLKLFKLFGRNSFSREILNIERLQLNLCRSDNDVREFIYLWQLWKSGNLKNRSYSRPICLIKFLLYLLGIDRPKMLKINVKKILLLFLYMMYDLFHEKRRKNICYVKIMLGRGLTDYGKSMALYSMEY